MSLICLIRPIGRKGQISCEANPALHDADQPVS